MKGKNLLVLLVVLGVLVGLAYWTSSKRKGQSAPSTLIGKLVLPDLPVNDVERIVFEGASSTVTVAKVGGIWSAPEKYNYPVDFDKVGNFLRTLADLKIGDTVSQQKEMLSTLELVWPAAAVTGDVKRATTRVRLEKGGNAAIAGILLGKNHERKSSGPPGMGGGYPDGRYISAGDRAVLVKETFSSVPAEVKDWFEADLVNAYSSDMTEVTVIGPEREPVKLLRKTKDGSLEPETVGADEEVETSKVNSLAGALNYLRMKDVADPALSDEKMGLATPVVCTFKAKEGKVYTVKLGAATEDKSGRYMRLSAEYKPAPEESAAGASGDVKDGKKKDEKVAGTETNKADDAKKKEEDAKAESQKKAKEEIAKINDKCGKWTYVIASYNGDSFLIKKNEFLKKKEKKEEPKKDEQAAEKKEDGKAVEKNAEKIADKQKAKTAEKKDAASVEKKGETKAESRDESKEKP